MLVGDLDAFPKVEQVEKMMICAICIGEPFLHDLVEKKGEEGQCDYCGDTGSGISLEDLAERVETAFKTHYERTSAETEDWQYPLLSDKELDYEWEGEGELSVDAIMNAADIPEEAAREIQKILADKYFDFDEAAMGVEGEFSSEAHYKEISPGSAEWQEGWHFFEKTIKTEARFFSRVAAEQLSKLFDNIDQMRTLQGQPLIIDAGPGTNHTHLYRARVFPSDDKLKLSMMRPDKELSAPPSHFASAGRMNARGISVFYGATSISTALAEVRPPVGSNVAVARFEIIRPLRLLDLSALAQVNETGSIFDTGYAYRLGRMVFLRELSQRIVRPVMPDDEASEYLPTQAIADFLATEGKVPLDGILYPSVQVNGDGLNAVLFHKAAKCQKLEFPKGTELKASVYTLYDEGPERDYTVTEAVPPKVKTPDEDTSLVPFERMHLQHLDLPDYDEREETLSVDLESMRVHCVKAVQIDTSEFAVRRYRYINHGDK